MKQSAQWHRSELFNNSQMVLFGAKDSVLEVVPDSVVYTAEENTWSLRL